MSANGWGYNKLRNQLVLMEQEIPEVESINENQWKYHWNHPLLIDSQGSVFSLIKFRMGVLGVK